MDIRQLQYLVALARERHFTRAAEACRVTQPTLSGRLRQLEQELGVAIVERGQRFHGFTPEGERVLAWAQRILGDVESLGDELAAMRGSVGGRVSLGVIPSALPTAPPLTALVREALPGVGFTLLSRSSREILRQLEEFSLDLGVTYLDREPVAHCTTRPLYRERYALFVRAGHPLWAREAVGWAEAAAHPLALLTAEMQNRRIVDAAFREAGARPAPELEADTAMALCAHLLATGVATVLPAFYLGLMGGRADLRAIPLVSPEVAPMVGLVALERDPQPRLVAAVLSAAARYRLPAAFGGAEGDAPGPEGDGKGL